MIYDHDVKHNGVWYPMGADVPVGTTTVKEEPKVEPVEEKAVEKPKVGRKKRV